MKIYNSTEYIEPKNMVVGVLKLEVISQWDFETKTSCFGVLYEGEKNEKTIAYSLKKCVEVRGDITKWERIEIDEEIKKELIEKGYIPLVKKGAK
jgi:hypothetical protein